MEIKILHIDDDPEVLQQVNDVINGFHIADDTLLIKDSCGFEEGLEKLKTQEYDLVILDLCVGDANEESDKVGEDVFNQIKERAFLPVVFFTGLPEYVRHLESPIVRIAGKGIGYDELFEQITIVLASGFIKLKSEVNDIIKEGVRSYFWNFVHPNSAIIAGLREDDVSLKYLLLRRLAKTLSSELIKNSVDDPQMKKELCHPMEFYIYPPVDGEFETGDIIKSKEGGNIHVILTPACDLIQRANGKRKAERILIVHALDFLSLPEYRRMKELQSKQEELNKEQKELAKEELGQLKNLPSKLKDLMRPGNDRYFFLPKTPFLRASLVDFQHKLTITYEELENNYDVLATLDDPFAQSMQSSFLRYYNRVGFPDLDVDYTFSKLE